MNGSAAGGGGEARALPVVWDAGVAMVGGAPPPAWRLAVWRAPNATLWWDAVDPDVFGAVVTDATSAAGWIRRAWGVAAADALTAGATDAVEVLPGALADAARRVALARWRRAWWPASRIALIPPLDPRLTAAELALALADLARAETVGDAAAAASGTEDEIDRALASLAAAERRLGPLEAAHPVAAPVRALAAERGAAVPSEPPRSAAPALVRAPEPARAPLSGMVPVDSSAVPNGVIDAADEARWRVVFRGASAAIVLEILAAPTFGDEPSPEPELYASFAGATARLDLRDGTWTAEHPVPLAALTTPPADRVVQVFVPGRDARPAAPASERIRIARERLLSPASPSEADAAARPIA